MSWLPHAHYRPAFVSARRMCVWPLGPPAVRSPAVTRSVDDVVNRALLASVVENEPLLDSKLASAAAGAGLPPAIPPGMRAMAVKVNDVIGVAGFIDSGTRVDLVVTIRKREESSSRTVVSNVQVLTAGTRLEQQKARASNTTPSAAVVTLLVSPTDAERIALAQAEGQIVLILRNPLDTAPTETEGVRTAALFGVPTPPVAAAVQRVSAPRPAPKPVPVVAAQKPYMVEAIRGRQTERGRGGAVNHVVATRRAALIGLTFVLGLCGGLVAARRWWTGSAHACSGTSSVDRRPLDSG